MDEYVLNKKLEREHTKAYDKGYRDGYIDAPN